MAKQYFGQIGLLKEEMTEEYRRLHAAVWPEVLSMIGECNIRNYSIFIHGNEVFSYFEYVGTDYDSDMKKMALDEATQRWWKCTHPCFRKYAIDENSEFYHDMEQIFYYDR